ncbi:nicotinate-nucleotide adenylyltransferase [Oceanirhabdus sp. W0125-5]|uniref:nicotinate-nucleotide adenylyltransferase n=1 Tax=Oceanirhabdus sp. W0125-5 TaxID=2999116 RepID=UPI0022F322BC|nr:nicotinate-nucleotide adenylyltransferase [Oceanirhabdus sp. W0125-5]WBW99792.1 nicotinate-nucleotide adenylyltransferase [Oceanirhabdus sp. W0125-5]
MFRKAIFGGTFDPIHNGHINIAFEALEKLNLDEIIFMPSGDPPHKADKIITDGFFRLEMTRMVVECNEKFTVSDYEIKKKGKSYTYETMKYFNDKYKDTQWFFIAGLDSLMYIHEWAKPEKIFENCKVIILVRSGFKNHEVMERKEKIEKAYGTEIILLDIPRLDISSTDIRERLKEDRYCGHLMPRDVEHFTKSVGLYKCER